MKRIINFTLMLCCMMIFLFITGCKTEGDLRIVNQTNHNIYATVEGVNYTIVAMQTKVITIDTPTQTWFSGPVGKDLPIHIEGETWLIKTFDNSDHVVWLKDTIVHIEAGKTLSIYCQPNRASVKIINHNALPVIAMTCTRHYLYGTSQTETIPIPLPIVGGDTFFAQIQPYDTLDSQRFYYTFQLQFEDMTWGTYGGNNAILSYDDQFIIELNALY